ncbi:hypothetical protein CGZ92_01570 [Parenemella sanctibonifatiensis]|uniref:NodB homology domain-containing protein n=1 Tax=Parenemella sanctibonifatiensis TaxID=2016505 RepID=A0A255EKI9_9ACTN|nr:hypothetical protein CGZ92_01570 [Parenemella sanctibonifatiensis]
MVDILASKGVPATFFVLGPNAKAHPEVLQKIARTDGLEIGNHSWNHPQLTKLGEAKIAKELGDTNDVIERITGHRPSLMRPPYGARNKTTDRAAADEGMAVILWSVDTLDWKTRSKSANIKAAIQAPPGSIILMHDIHRPSVQAVPEIIDQMRAEGHCFTNVSGLYDAEPGHVYTGE